MQPSLSLFALTGLPLVNEGDDLCELVLEACTRLGLTLERGDVLVLAQKIVSKAEGRTVRLETIEPSERACELAQEVDKDARLVELILRESKAVVRTKPGVLIVEDRRGLTLANAGIDHSNVAQRGTNTATAEGTDTVLLLPEKPDRSADVLRARIKDRTNTDVGVLICDSLGRPWRIGTTGVAIGCSGLPSVLDYRGQPDLFGETLRTTDVGHADQLAAAASILLGQTDEGVPAALVRGAGAFTEQHPTGPATDLLRPAESDLFR